MFFGGIRVTVIVKACERDCIGDRASVAPCVEEVTLTRGVRVVVPSDFTRPEISDKLSPGSGPGAYCGL